MEAVISNRRMSEILCNQQPITLPPHATVQDACKIMHKHRVGATLVTDAKGKLVGTPDAMRCVCWPPARTARPRSCGA
jgi:CBS domain-containing protein